MYAHYQQYQNQTHQYHQQPQRQYQQQQQQQQQYQQQYQQQQQQQQQHRDPPNNDNQIVPPNPVQTFTQYYHGWTGRVDQLTNELKTCSDHSERQTKESDRQWAKYYAEESSRAAHHFHQNPQARSAPFALPSAPPVTGPTISTSTSTSTPTRNSHHQSNNHHAGTKTYASAARSSGAVQGSNNSDNNSNESNQSAFAYTPTPTPTSGNNNTTNNPPGSITRYVKRNMERHQVKSDTGLKKHVQAEIEKVIAAAIRAKTLQSKNWDLVPLIALPGVVETETESKTKTKTTGASVSTATPAPAQDRYQQYQNQQQQQQNQQQQQQQQQQNQQQQYHHQNQQQRQQPYSGRHYYEHNSFVAPPNNTNYHGSMSNGNNSNYNHYGSNTNTNTNTSHGSGTRSTSGTYDSYYGPAGSPRNNNNNNNNNTNDKIQNQNSNTNHSTHNFRQNASHGNKHNGNSLSSSPLFIGQTKKNKNGKRHHHHHDDDFSAAGHYGPAAATTTSGPGLGSSSSSSPTHNVRGKHNHKKLKKNQWKNPESFGMDYSKQAMDKRANRFSGRGGIREATSATVRAGSGGGHDKYMGKGTIGGDDVTLTDTDFEKMTVKGTSATLEKNYLRLTAPPRAELVRPLEILKLHLRNLQREYYGCGAIESSPGNETKKGDRDTNTNTNALSILQERMKTPQAKWTDTDDGTKTETETELASNDSSSPNRFGRRKRRDYLWFCSQLKAIRQDCTVQRIQGDMAVDVYETHARIALQEGDLNEYNQCQTQLKELYKTLPLTGTDTDTDTDTDTTNRSFLVRDDGTNGDWKHKKEFIAYRLLYYVFLSTNETYSGGSSDMYHIMLSLTASERNDPAISHALKVREAVALSDYFWFFRLHKTSPNLGIFLTELLVPTVRLRGLRRIARAYRPSIDLDVCFTQLGILDHQTHDDACMNMNMNANANANENTDGGENKKAVNDGAKNDGRDNSDGGKMIMEEAKSWLISCGGVIEGSKFITKDSDIHAPVTKDAKRNSLI